MRVVLTDGGRAAAGFRGITGDCVCRSIAIATERSYREVYDALNDLAGRERVGKRKRSVSNSRTGVYRTTYGRYLDSLGWRWTPTMRIGSGCGVHLKADELPAGRLVVSVSRHMTAVIDGVIHDTHDPSRGGKRCVYGFYAAAAAPVPPMAHPIDPHLTAVRERYMRLVTPGPGQWWTNANTKREAIGVDATRRALVKVREGEPPLSAGRWAKAEVYAEADKLACPSERAALRCQGEEAEWKVYHLCRLAGLLPN